MDEKLNWDRGTAGATLAAIGTRYWTDQRSAGTPAEFALNWWISVMVLVTLSFGFFPRFTRVGYEPWISWPGAITVQALWLSGWYLWYWRVALWHRRLPTIWEALLAWLLVPTAFIGGICVRWGRDAVKGPSK